MHSYFKYVVYLSVILTLSSCSSDTLSEENLVGKWQVVDYWTEKEMSPNLENLLRQYAISTVYSFKDDGTMWSSGLPSYEKFHCEWELIKDSSKLVIYGSIMGEITRFEKIITEFSNDSMKWSFKDHSGHEIKYTLEKVGP